ncbi:MAG: chemotaxis protein CheB [Kofleriaceae bacterium]
MLKRDIVVVGASAGGVEALRDLISGLSSDLDASIFVVLHVPPYAPSRLPEVLAKHTPFEVVHAGDGWAVRRKCIYVAPPDHHLILEGERMIVRRGPKENRFRPSVDALFRSAAYVYRARTIGVVLSGALDDGTSGLWSIKRMGGLAVIQDPTEALYSDMPDSARRHINVDHVMSAGSIGPLIGKLTVETPEGRSVSHELLYRLALEASIAARDDAFEDGILDWGIRTSFTCPECHGALTRIEEELIVRFRCHTGHAFSASSLLSGITSTIEQSLWSAMRAVEEQAMLLEHLAHEFMESGQAAEAKLFADKSFEARARARVIHASLPGQEQQSASTDETEER